MHTNVLWATISFFPLLVIHTEGSILPVVTVNGIAILTDTQIPATASLSLSLTRNPQLIWLLCVCAFCVSSALFLPIEGTKEREEQAEAKQRIVVMCIKCMIFFSLPWTASRQLQMAFWQRNVQGMEIERKTHTESGPTVFFNRRRHAIGWIGDISVCVFHL